MPTQIVDVESLKSESWLSQTDCLNLKKLVLKFGMNNKAVLVNEGSEKASIKAGTALCGFGRTTWVSLKPSEELRKEDLLVEFSSGADMVMFKDKLQSLQEVIEKKRSNNPQCKVLYHRFVEEIHACAKLTYQCVGYSAVHRISTIAFAMAMAIRRCERHHCAISFGF